MKKFTPIFLLFLVLISYSNTIMCQTKWKLKETGTTNELKAVDFINETTGIVVGMMGLIMKTTDGGDSWITIDLGLNNGLNDIQYIDENRVIIGGDQGIVLYSNDGGDNWDIVQESGQGYNINGISVDLVSGHGIAGATGNTIIWSEDWGLSWTYIEGGFMNNYNSACMAGGDFGAVFGKNAIFQPLAGYTLDGGQTWDGQPYYPTNNNNGYEATAYDCYFFSSNDGFTVGNTFLGDGFITTSVDWNDQFWDALLFPGVFFFGIDFLDNSYGAAVGGDYMSTTYIFETFDGGLNWESATVEGNGNTMLDVTLVGTTGYAVGSFGELLKKDIATNVPHNNINPVNMYNYPNPSKDRTEIFFDLKDPQQIEISLFNMSGKLVKKLYQAHTLAGKHTITLNTSDLPGGVYQYTLKGENILFSQKLVVE